MKKIVAVYTGQGLSGPLEALIKEELPDFSLTNIIDDGLIHAVIQNNGVTKAIARRLITYYQLAADMGADLILNTCSSVGSVVDLAREIIDVPLFKIDEPMAKEAAQSFGTVGVIATLATTLVPTVQLIEDQASQVGKEVRVVSGLAAGAYQALIEGNQTKHDDLISIVGLRLADAGADCLVLAQGSMMRMQTELAEITGKPVLASPPLWVQSIPKLLVGAGQ